MTAFSADVLVIGSGIAGLSAALQIAEKHTVIVATKREAAESNTRYAQGGISSVLSQDDSFEAHIEDTLAAGAGLCVRDVVRLCVTEGPASVHRLVNWGVEFDRNRHGEYDLGREGGHSQRRVLHAGDITGAEIQRALLQAAKENPNIRLFEHWHAIDLITTRKHFRRIHNRVVGAYFVHAETGQVSAVKAAATLLATGGAGKVYRYTSNPNIATGDGIAMAYRVGGRIANLEFFQFHPTCLYHPQAQSFLISEALRGEGGILKTVDRSPFMKAYHPMGSLAPRDIVARAIDAELKRRGDKHVFLDMTHLDGAYLKTRFPNIHARCLDLDIDMTVDMIPVVPAAHYMCGGIVVDTHGDTGVDGLFAIGEVSCTGLHGANRLASNSLLEGAVYSFRASHRVCQLLASGACKLIEAPLPPWHVYSAREPDEAVIIEHAWNEIRHTMWNYVGIVRSNSRLTRARRRIELLREEIEAYYWRYFVTPDLVELRNLALVAQLVIRSAQIRKESRGLHYNLDYPEADPPMRPEDTILRGP
ncbi:MAG: L-aspartate oxidase [Myxococcota bacterium]|nr:L-aspartate oxidase [Myxococcota bacterium]